MAEDEKTEAKPGTGETPVTPEAPAGNGESATETEPGEKLTLAEAQAWKGFRLDDIGGGTVGKIEGVYVDSRSGEPEWLLARMGRFGHRCLVPARDAVGAAGHVWVPYSRDQIRKAPRMDPDKPLEQQSETVLLEHYGVGSTAVGRGAALADRDPSAVTARAAQQ